MKKAVLYARVSSDLQQKEGTIDSQIAELKRQISKAGHDLIKEYVDNGYSGALLDRPAMNELRDDIKTDVFETIYFLTADRIARDVTYQNIIVGEILRCKKQIVIGGQDYLHNPENKFTLTVLGAVSELERAKIVERSQRGRKYKLHQGVLMSNGCKIFGYDYHRKTLDSVPCYTLNKQEAPLVQKIFEMYARGDASFVQIANHLAEKRAYRRSGSRPWNKHHIRTILGNISYTGIKYFDTMTDANAQEDPMHKSKTKKMIARDQKEWIGIQIPSIVSLKLYTAVQQRLTHNQSCYRNAQRKQLLSGLLWCSECGSRCFSYRRYYRVKRAKGVTVYEKLLYTCSGRKKVGYCTTTQIDVRVLEHLVFEIITNSATNETSLRDSIPLLKTRGRRSSGPSKAKVNKLQKQLSEINAKKERILDLYTSGDIDKAVYMERTDKYEKLTEQIKKQLIGSTKKSHTIDKVVLTESIKHYCDAMKKHLSVGVDNLNRRQFLLDHISKITYSNTQVSVCGAITVNEDSIEYEIKQKIDRVALREEILRNDRIEGLCGTPIRRSDFGHLAGSGKILSMHTL